MIIEFGLTKYNVCIYHEPRQLLPNQTWLHKWLTFIDTNNNEFYRHKLPLSNRLRSKSNFKFTFNKDYINSVINKLLRHTWRNLSWFTKNDRVNPKFITTTVVSWQRLAHAIIHVAPRESVANEKYNASIYEQHCCRIKVGATATGN